MITLVACSKNRESEGAGKEPEADNEWKHQTRGSKLSMWSINKVVLTEVTVDTVFITYLKVCLVSCPNKEYTVFKTAPVKLK